MDYKESLLLPKTTFAMRGNLVQNEPKRYAKWFTENVYDKMKQNREDAEAEFTLHDGPPYANGHTHIGHALNKVLKDMIVKFHYFNGKKVRYTPGWDCHGLPIEQQVEKKLGGKAKKEQLSTAQVRKLCREHAAKFVDIQRDEFKKLGITGDWDHPYLTMDYAFEANIYRTLCQVAQKGLLVERSKPVYWSWAERTALAEAEVEYEDKESDSIYVAFELSTASKERLGLSGKAAPVIWTTTPWTLPANTAISFNPEEVYVLTTDGYIVARALFDSLKEQEVIKGEVAQELAGKSLENLEAINPLNERTSKLILGEHVLMDNGTGCVHTAPGHGEDDYKVGLLYDLDVVMPVNENGCYDETLTRLALFKEPEAFVGMHIFKANPLILELLGSALLKAEKFIHSYPHCWRSHKPVIFRATKQWFISVDAKPEGEEKTLREIALDSVKKTKFYPEWGENRLTAMVENRPDWCISRQRDWGVPIAFFRNKKTGEVVLDEKVLNFIAMIFEQQGTDAWYELDIAQLLYPGSGLNPTELEKVNDILDVWFDSGSTWNAVLKSLNYDSGKYQADMYLEGSDQHRGWFQSSLFLSCAIEHQAPYKSVLTHGFTVDEKGEKMSKSKGNVVAPEKVLKEFGSEILRLWVAMSDYQSDLKISNGILKQMAELYRKIRNTFRFLLANISDLEEVLPVEKLGVLDLWILKKAKAVFDEVHANFAEYDFSRGMNVLNNFLVNDLSGVYMDLCKDRLYCDGKNDTHRLASQSAMAYIAKSFMGLVAPILTYTVDEIIEHAPVVLKGDASDAFDIVYEPIPAVEVDFNESYMISAREKLQEVVDGLKKEKRIKSTLELSIAGFSETLKALDKTEVEDWFLVSQVAEELEGECVGEFKVENDDFKIYLATQEKCPRCWKFQASEPESLCPRCDKVMNA